jgi:hypothetical protein
MKLSNERSFKHHLPAVLCRDTPVANLLCLASSLHGAKRIGIPIIRSTREVAFLMPSHKLSVAAGRHRRSYGS